MRLEFSEEGAEGIGGNGLEIVKTMMN